MLLKVADGVGGWVIFDQVDKVHLIATSYTVKTSAELNKIAVGENQLNLVSKECFAKGEAFDVGVVEFERRGTTQRAFFVVVAYVCNDKGDTLDRLVATGSQKRR